MARKVTKAEPIQEKKAQIKTTVQKKAPAKPKPAAKSAPVKEKKTPTPAVKKTATKVEPAKKQPSKVTKRQVKEPEILEAPTINNFPSLKKGSNETGPITFLQANLKQRGFYKGPIDGNFGPNTEKAVIEFQKALDKPVSGTVGPKTWEALQKSDVRAKVVTPVAAPQPQPQQQAGSAAGTRVLIEGLSKFQAELLVKLLSGHTECRIL